MKYLTLLLSLVLLFLSGCQHEEHKKYPEATYEISNPVRRDTTINRQYISQIHAFQHIELRALEKGYLQKILVDEGQRVKRGQLLFSASPRPKTSSIS